MKKSLQEWMEKNPEKSLGRGRTSQFKQFEQELTTLLESGYTTQKIAQYLHEVEKVPLRKKDGKYVVAALSNYLRELAQTHGIKRKRGRAPA
mgnify:CR=1 FL=1